MTSYQPGNILSLLLWFGASSGWGGCLVICNALPLPKQKYVHWRCFIGSSGGEGERWRGGRGGLCLRSWNCFMGNEAASLWPEDRDENNWQRLARSKVGGQGSMWNKAPPWERRCCRRHKTTPWWISTRSENEQTTRKQAEQWVSIQLCPYNSDNNQGLDLIMVRKSD